MKRSVVLLLHIGYWVMYLLLVFFFLHFLPLSHKGRTLAGWFYLLFVSPLALSLFLPAVLGFYCFYTFLFTRYLKRKKILALSISGPGIAVGCGSLCLLLVYLFYLPGPFVKVNWTAETAVTVGITLSLLALVHGMIGLVLRGFITSYEDIQLKEDLNKKNYETELALIKAQINPHFLFNTINNIDVLIEKDAKLASQYLNKLSDIMRFMLYETKTEKILLEKELLYIEKYIDLQKIRSFNPDYIHYSVEGKVGPLLIEPMLFIPFIENAFKHTENKKMGNAIRVRFVLEGDTINFECENQSGSTLFEKTDKPDEPDYNGLGNELIRKRLTLLYPGRHVLTVTHESNMYQVKLSLFV